MAVNRFDVLVTMAAVAVGARQKEFVAVKAHLTCSQNSHLSATDLLG